MKTTTPDPETHTEWLGEQLLDCYLEKGANACARRFRIPASSVRTIMREAGVPMRTQGQQKPIVPTEALASWVRKPIKHPLTWVRREALIKEYRQGVPGEAVRVAKKYGISDARVYQILKAYRGVTQ